ncbi:MAG: Fic family protein [Planctomycetaceae bacterium]|nr:Fic family protein [Planctomycetaceae bacterium]
MKPFVPHALPPDNLDFGALIGLVGEASAAVARYDGMLESVVNPAILLSPLTTQEAVLSSKIEGTQATLNEVLEHEAGQIYDEEKTRDIQEIVNYRSALFLAGEAIETRPLSLSMLLHLHRILMDSVRGQNKSPGELRKDQNWLGPHGCEMEQATYVPPNPLQLMDHLQAWESYLQSDDVSPLIQCGVVHAQFEIIHPFKDGNGRIGRLLIPLFLKMKRQLRAPTFYLSAYLEAHRETYYAHLLGISQRDDWQSWLEFFLTAVAEQARSNTAKVKKTLDLYDRMKTQIAEVTRSQYAMVLLDAIFYRPVFETTEIITRIGLARQRVTPLLRKLRDAGTLRTLRESAGRQPAILCFPELVNIVEGREIL